MCQTLDEWNVPLRYRFYVREDLRETKEYDGVKLARYGRGESKKILYFFDRGQIRAALELGDHTSSMQRNSKRQRFAVVVCSPSSFECEEEMALFDNVDQAVTCAYAYADIQEQFKEESKWIMDEADAYESDESDESGPESHENSVEIYKYDCSQDADDMVQRKLVECSCLGTW